MINAHALCRFLADVAECLKFTAHQLGRLDEKGRVIVATRVIDLAREGLIDPAALPDRVIAEARLSE